VKLKRPRVGQEHLRVCYFGCSSFRLSKSSGALSEISRRIDEYFVQRVSEQCVSEAERRCRCTAEATSKA
jgi:hypothetical protein